MCCVFRIEVSAVFFCARINSGSAGCCFAVLEVQSSISGTSHQNTVIPPHSSGSLLRTVKSSSCSQVQPTAPDLRHNLWIWQVKTSWSVCVSCYTCFYDFNLAATDNGLAHVRAKPSTIQGYGEAKRLMGNTGLSNWAQVLN